MMFAIFMNFFIVFMQLDAKRPVVSPEQFIARMEQAGFVVEDRTYLQEMAVTHLVANNGPFEIEYMLHETIADARYTFSRLGGSITLGTTIRTNLFSQFIPDESFLSITRTHNIVVFMNAPLEYFMEANAAFFAATVYSTNVVSQIPETSLMAYVLVAIAVVLYATYSLHKWRRSVKDESQLTKGDCL